MIFFVDIFSFKNRKLNIETNIYPDDSIVLEKDMEIPFKAKTVNRVEAKNKQ